MRALQRAGGHRRQARRLGCSGDGVGMSGRMQVVRGPCGRKEREGGGLHRRRAAASVRAPWSGSCHSWHAWLAWARAGQGYLGEVLGRARYWRAQGMKGDLGDMVGKEERHGWRVLMVGVTICMAWPCQCWFRASNGAKARLVYCQGTPCHTLEAKHCKGQSKNINAKSKFAL